MMAIVKIIWSLNLNTFFFTVKRVQKRPSLEEWECQAIIEGLYSPSDVLALHLASGSTDQRSDPNGIPAVHFVNTRPIRCPFNGMRYEFGRKMFV